MKKLKMLKDSLIDVLIYNFPWSFGQILLFALAIVCVCIGIVGCKIGYNLDICEPLNQKEIMQCQSIADVIMEEGLNKLSSYKLKRIELIAEDVDVPKIFTEGLKTVNFKNLNMHLETYDWDIKQERETIYFFNKQPNRFVLKIKYNENGEPKQYAYYPYNDRLRQAMEGLAFALVIDIILICISVFSYKKLKRFFTLVEEQYNYLKEKDKNNESEDETQNNNLEAVTSSDELVTQAAETPAPTEDN